MIKVELNKPSISRVPKYLPENLKNRIQDILDAFKYAETNPYYSYFLQNSENKYIQKLSKEKMDEERWQYYLKKLNGFSSCLCLITDLKMKSVWEKLNKLNSDNLVSIFTYITSCFNSFIGNSVPLFLLSEIPTMTLKKDYSTLIENFEDMHLNMHLLIGKISPDGADCFENMDANDPKNKMYLDENGKPPYKINWDLMIKDEEYETFMFLLGEIIEKLKNRKKYNELKRNKLVNTINKNNSRKKHISNAKEIEFIKKIYRRFIMDFKKPCYNEICIITEILFNSTYNEDNIKKHTKNLRKDIQELKKIIKEKGKENYYNTSYIEKKL
ncbi:MAG: hypothetical protein B6I23_01630 [Rickettsiaceae bacterium 4572_127]|nr:MAG: hypothetical protein B6I23_01630 [Rickettsiaceae bacterium 4572_127]